MFSISSHWGNEQCSAISSCTSKLSGYFSHSYFDAWVTFPMVILSFGGEVKARMRWVLSGFWDTESAALLALPLSHVRAQSTNISPLLKFQSRPRTWAGQEKSKQTRKTVSILVTFRWCLESDLRFFCFESLLLSSWKGNGFSPYWIKRQGGDGYESRAVEDPSRS